MTLQLIPLDQKGFGATLAAGRRGALRWADLIEADPALRLYQRPELDIVTYFPATGEATLSAVDAASDRVLRTGMSTEDDPVFLSVLRVDAEAFRRRHPDLTDDAATAHVLRSVLLKPEAESYLDHLHGRVHRLATDVTEGDTVRTEVVPAASADTDRLVDLLTRCFHDDPLMAWAFPDERRRAEIVPEFFRAHLEIALDYAGVYTTPRRDAALLFLPPGAWEKVAARDAELTELFAGIAGEYWDSLSTIMELQAQRHPDGRHCYVSFICVDSRSQHRGTGNGLVEALMASADREGVPVYTETSSAGGAGLGRRHGFVPTGADIVLPDGPSLRPMWRVPR